MNEQQQERRAWPRVSTVAWIEASRGRLRPGRSAQILDVSAGGVLIETDWRLLPGTRVEVHLGEPNVLHRVKGRILRCHVVLLSREHIRYRGAVVFDTELLFSGNDRPVGSACTSSSGESCATVKGNEIPV